MGPDPALSVSLFFGVLLLVSSWAALVFFSKLSAVRLWGGSWAWAGVGCLVTLVYPHPSLAAAAVLGSQGLMALGFLSWFGLTPSLGKGVLARTVLWGGTLLSLGSVLLGAVGRDPTVSALVTGWALVPAAVSVWLLVFWGRRDGRVSVKAQSASLLGALALGTIPGLVTWSVLPLFWGQDGAWGFAPFFTLAAGLTLRSLVHFDTRFHHHHTASFVVEKTQDPVVFLQADGRIQAVNPAFLQLVHRDEDSVLGTPVTHWGADTESCRLLAPLEALTFPDWEGTLALAHAGKPVPVHVVYRRVHNPAREAVGAVLLVHDLRAPHRLDLSTREDTLTSLSNRRWVLELLEAEFLRSQRYGGALSALWLTVDRWDELKARAGREGADDVLRRIAGVLRGGLRKTDFCGRVGADDFLVVLPETPPDRACLVAARLEKMFALAGEEDAGTGLRIGLASLDESMGTTDDFLARVRAAVPAERPG